MQAAEAAAAAVAAAEAAAKAEAEAKAARAAEEEAARQKEAAAAAEAEDEDDDEDEEEGSESESGSAAASGSESESESESDSEYRCAVAAPRQAGVQRTAYPGMDYALFGRLPTNLQLMALLLCKRLPRLTCVCGLAAPPRRVRQTVRRHGSSGSPVLAQREMSGSGKPGRPATGMSCGRPSAASWVTSTQA